jgi:hypothetical protein
MGKPGISESQSAFSVAIAPMREVMEKLVDRKICALIASSEYDISK